MKVILVVEDIKGKNILFITDYGQALSLEEALLEAQAGKIDNSHVVNADKTSFIRSNPNKIEIDNLDALTISYNQLEKGLSNYDEIKNHPSLQCYEKNRSENIVMSDDIIFVDGCPRKNKSDVVKYLTPYTMVINQAAKKQEIDPNLLGAILIDEYLRLGPDDMFDWAAKIGIDTSIGIAQVSVETARSLIKRGLYNPNQHDPKFNTENIDETGKGYFYKYLKEPVHSVNFAAAKIRSLIEDWKKYVGISKNPAVLGSLYSMYKQPHANPIANDRGKQIAKEFYIMSENALNIKVR
jgi:hypothetical protein